MIGDNLNGDTPSPQMKVRMTIMCLHMVMFTPVEFMNTSLDVRLSDSTDYRSLPGKRPWTLMQCTGCLPCVQMKINGRVRNVQSYRGVARCTACAHSCCNVACMSI